MISEAVLQERGFHSKKRITIPRPSASAVMIMAGITRSFLLAPVSF